MLENSQKNISMHGCSRIQGTRFYSRWNFMKPGSQSKTYLFFLVTADITPHHRCHQFSQCEHVLWVWHWGLQPLGPGPDGHGPGWPGRGQDVQQQPLGRGTVGQELQAWPRTHVAPRRRLKVLHHKSPFMTLTPWQFHVHLYSMMVVWSPLLNDGSMINFTQWRFSDHLYSMTVLWSPLLNESSMISLTRWQFHDHLYSMTVLWSPLLYVSSMITFTQWRFYDLLDLMTVPW